MTTNYQDAIANRLIRNSLLPNMADEILAEMPTEPINLSGTYKTVVGISTVEGTSYEAHDSSDARIKYGGYRDVLLSVLRLKIDVLSARNGNNRYCQEVTKYIASYIMENHEFYDNGWRMFIESAKISFPAPDRPGRWPGVIEMEAVYYQDNEGD